MATATETTPVAEARKNATETIRVIPTVYRGIELVDVRVYYTPPAGEAIPTRKGLCLRPELWAELLVMIAEALDHD